MIPDQKVQDWKDHNCNDRLQMCRILLNLHGFLTDAENDRVSQRLFKWRMKHAEQQRKATK